MRRFLSNIAGPSGTLLVLDHLQWAGPDALDLLTNLLRSVAALPVRVIGAYRTTEVRPQEALAVFLADLAGAELVAQTELGPLAPKASAELLDGLLTGATEEALRQRERILAASDGMPFFLVSCAQALQSGALEETAPEAIPWTVAQSIRQRVAALPEAAQDLLGIAAVAGRTVQVTMLIATALLAGASGFDPPGHRESGPTLGRVGRRDLSISSRSHPRGGGSRSERGTARHLHRLVATALERGTAACPAEVLAYHYRRAGELEAALGYFLQAAERARQAVAHREVACLLAEAIDLAVTPGNRN